MLYRLNNIEKHRLLLTVGSQAGGVHLGQMVAPTLEKTGVAPEFLDMIKALDTYLVPLDKGFPLKEGFELLIGAVDENPNPNQKFIFDIALNESGIVEGTLLHHTVTRTPVLSAAGFPS